VIEIGDSRYLVGENILAERRGMTYDESMAFWFGRINYETRSATPADLKLERMQALLRLLGDPQRAYRIVHITGTKGKGSTAAMIEAMLRANGYRVGLFTSPHLIHVEERTQIDRICLSRGEFAFLMGEVADAVRQLETLPFPGPTFFEISTALALLAFQRRRCDWVILEVGLGGRFDSTNVCQPEVSVITSVGFDHMAQLGNTLTEIAYQKAGIIKSGVPVVSGVMESEPAEVIDLLANELNAPLVSLSRHVQFEYVMPRVSVRLPGFVVESVPLKLLGHHQARNAALAVATVQVLRQLGVPVSERAILTGLATVQWPARIEVLHRNPAIVLDTAHNVPSIEALLNTVEEAFPNVKRKRVLFAVSSDKQYTQMLELLAKCVDELYLTKYGNNPRCVSPEKLASTLSEVAPTAVHFHADKASDVLELALAKTQPDDLLIVTGSVFLAGELQPTLLARFPQAMH
jgi:dihydrofolate synthase / folylpolyglutamate synthase